MSFLFKLTNGERDLCIGMNINNRYRDELMSMIGMFDNVIPLRCQLDPHWSFHQLVDHVREIITSSMRIFLFSSSTHSCSTSEYFKTCISRYIFRLYILLKMKIPRMK